MSAPDATETRDTGSDHDIYLDALTHGEIILRRAKVVAQQITDRIKTVAGDTSPEIALKDDTRQDIPTLPPGE